MTGSTHFCSVSACISWENATNGKVPDDAWDAVGDDDVGANLYIGRAEHNGGMFPGTLVPDKGVAHIPKPHKAGEPPSSLPPRSHKNKTR